MADPWHPPAGSYLFAATLLYKINASTTVRMRGRLVLKGTTEIRVSFGEVIGAHVSEATALWLQTMVALTAGDTVELQGNFRAADGYFAAGSPVLLGREDRLREVRHGAPTTRGLLRPHAGARVRSDPGARSPMSGSKATSMPRHP